MKVDLHIPSWNRPKMTELVLRTIKRNTKPEHYRTVVFDHGSTKETQEKLRQLADNGLIDELIIRDDNIGLEGARQYMLMNCTESDFFICVDNDCLPPPMSHADALTKEPGRDWIEELYYLMDKYGDVAAISCRTPAMIGTGNIFEFADQTGDDIVEFPHPGGSLRIMRTEITKAIGGWDRLAPGRGSEETFICGKLRDAGFRTAFAVNIRCMHLFGTRGEDNMTDRWGYDKNMAPEDSGHRDIDHPALRNGDSFEEIAKFAGEELARDYCNNPS